VYKLSYFSGYWETTKEKREEQIHRDFFSQRRMEVHKHIKDIRWGIWNNRYQHSNKTLSK